MGKKRILVVDDEPDITHLIKMSLEQSGEFEVMEETQSQHALAAAQQFNPHLILCDVLMPTLDGGDVAALIKADPKLKDVPLVFLTATVLQEEVDEKGGVIAGHCFIAKPVEMKTLIALINRTLA